jgi:gluconolactonase
MRDIKTKLLLMIPSVIVIPWSLFAQLQAVGSVERMDPALDAIVPADARIEKLAGGFKFTEGPVWVHSGYLLFSDIPNNVINKWTPDGKVTMYLKPSGYSGPIPPSGDLPGSNGLTLDQQGRLLICQHGNRRLVRVEKNGKQTVLADTYKGKRLNSPNDVVVKSDGSIYFTDPPYGLPKEDADPAKELSFNGVFRLASGKLEPLIKDLTRPNGIAFSPGEKFLYISVSDPARKVWMRYDVGPGGTLANGKVFYDVTLNKEDGLPDGMKIDRKGNVYGTGPGGVWIFSPQG